MIIAITIKLLLEKIFPKIIRIERKASTYINGGLLGFVFLIPALANYYNRSYPKTQANCKEFEITERSGSFYHGFYIYVNIENDNERLNVDKNFWDKTKLYGNVELCICKGGLGFEFVHEFRNVDH